ncbi:shikimate O-hydroxycinnamoyltransferase-like [Canna indica]|uniref:Shikimate O-hydroxycinnamoyltransferase-like n=1 Tax=Canna indica TaxID=4628 RepID=A0AAQ3L4I0_9LILI|nr:shikimate O-hydroxycinnamoyltransferase-like [Canna indica]
MGRSKGYAVTVTETATVVAASPPQEHRLPLSNLDLLLPPLDVGVFFCYKKPSAATKCSILSFNAMASSFKASLAQALDTYYPFAAEVVTNSLGEPELLCNNRGVDFVVAYADVELRELRLWDPMESVEGKLVPEKKAGVLCAQVTELKCGGLVVACVFDHRIADAYSTNMFLVAWSELATSKPLSRLPTFRRSLVTPRWPLRPDASFDRLYLPISSIPPPPEPSLSGDEAINRIYYITADDIRRLQSSTNKRTKTEAFTAYLWRALARAVPPEDASCRMGIVVDGRARLGGGASDMDDYFGNVLSIPYGTLGVEDLRRMELAEVADAVHGWLRRDATGEHFRGLVDWVEAHRPEPAVAKVYFREKGEGPACVISSGRWFPVTEVEFGWGKAAFGSYHFPWGGSTGYVMPMPSATAEGDWVVYVYVLKKVAEALEAEQPPVFRVLTPDYYLP